MAKVELTGNEWENFVKAHEYAVVDCYGDGCFACMLLEPVLQAVADDLAGVAFAGVNISHYPEISRVFPITAVPTVMLFRKGEKVGEFIGSLEREEVLQQIAALLYQ